MSFCIIINDNLNYRGMFQVLVYSVITLNFTTYTGYTIGVLHSATYELWVMTNVNKIYSTFT